MIKRCIIVKMVSVSTPSPSTSAPPPQISSYTSALVWQHSYMEHLPLTHNMTFFSDHYRPCTTRASGWCNIPNKARFTDATEQMIAAYHKGTVMYAYKGLLNRNIDYSWSGDILLNTLWRLWIGANRQMEYNQLLAQLSSERSTCNTWILCSKYRCILCKNDNNPWRIHFHYWTITSGTVSSTCFYVAAKW